MEECWPWKQKCVFQLLVVCPWPSPFPLASLSFFICNTGMIPLVPEVTVRTVMR